MSSVDWRSPNGLRYLREAHPDGHLAARGVHTVGGYVCVDVESCGDAHFLHPEGGPTLVMGRGRRSICARFNRGNRLTDGPDALLPMPDPADAATWACLLADLADALGVPNRPDEPNVGYLWHRLSDEERLDGEPPGWLLYVQSSGGWTDRRVHDVDVEDPAHALVIARARARRDTAGPSPGTPR